MLGTLDLRWYDEAALTVVMATKGYPGAYAKGSQIKNLETGSKSEDVVIFHAGTRSGPNGELLADGGRVLNVNRQCADHRGGAVARLRRRGLDRLARGLLSPRHRLARDRAPEMSR